MTEQQELREFWEWCGLTPLSGYAGRSIYTGFPELDLNLLKYAVPKIYPKTLMLETVNDYPKKGNISYAWCILSEKVSGGIWQAINEDPVQGLYEALNKLRKEAQDGKD